MNEVLKVTAISAVQEDVNGFPYKTITFSSPSEKITNTPMGLMKVKVPARSSGKNVQKHFYYDLNRLAKQLNKTKKDGSADYSKLTAEDLKQAPINLEWSFEVGDIVAGQIVTRKVEDYELADPITGEVNTRETYSRVILGETENKEAFEAAISQEFSSQERVIREDNRLPDLELVQNKVSEEVTTHFE